MKDNGNGDHDELDFFEPNPHDLGGEWIRQPKLYFQTATKLADANQELARAEAALDVLYAELDQSVRNDPQKHGIDLPEGKKPTETAVKSVILASDEHVAAEKKARRLKHAVDVYKAALVALDHKRDALENLVKMTLGNIYSPPKAPKDVSPYQARRAMDKLGGRKE